MKKLTALILILSLAFILISCGENEYPPVESSALESRVVMTIDFEGKKYEVKYELYRALFLNKRETIDGGDLSVWSGENKAEYIEKIDTLIKKDAADIYSVLHIADRIGIDVYSDEFDDIVSEYIELSVEGGNYGNQSIEGFEGNYDSYLESLKEMNLNYAVQDLLLRYSIASEKVFEYYAGYESEFIEELVQGELEYTIDDVKAFYNSDESVRVIRAHLPKPYCPLERAQQIRDAIAEKAKYGEREVAEYIISMTSTADSDMLDGEIIGRHTLDEIYYSEIERAAFDLAYFEVSDLIEVSDAMGEAYVVIYKTIKSNTHLEKCIEQVASAYIQNEVGKIIDTAMEGMLEGITESAMLSNLDRSNIKMD